MAGCYSSTPPGSGACYSVTTINGNISCYSSSPRPPCPNFNQSAPTPCYDTLCHDTATVARKFTLNRYYPVYIHLKEVTVTGDLVEEQWNPLCIVCTKAKPCDKHKNGQMPADLPPPAEDNPQPTSVVPMTPGSVPPPPRATALPPAAGESAGAIAGEVKASPSAIQRVSNVNAPPPASAPAQPAAAPGQAAAPAKQWVYYAQYGMWGYGSQRTDGMWDIDANS